MAQVLIFLSRNRMLSSMNDDGDRAASFMPEYQEEQEQWAFVRITENLIILFKLYLFHSLSIN